MKLLISPARKMREDGDFLAPRQAPALLERAAVLAEWLRGLDYTALKKLLACNDSIAELNFRRFQEMDLRRLGTPAPLSYDGIQYQCMAPHLFTQPQFEYAEARLRILSGLYGVLRPFDGVSPYRLEMGARCSTPFCKSLYGFWGDSLYRTLTAGGEDTLLNLTSAEYAKAVRPRVILPVRWIDVTFGETDGDKVVEKGVYVKMARGETVRFPAEWNAETPEAVQGFDRLGYCLSPAHSTTASYVFLREGRANQEVSMPQRLFCLLLGYPCGCFLTAELVARARTGKSAAALGIGDPDMVNLTHELGKGWGAVVLAGDIVKTALVFRLCRALFPALGSLSGPWAGLGAVLGHNFPLWRSFRGGKGVAVTCVALILFSLLQGTAACLSGLAVTLLSGWLPLGAVVVPALFVPPAFLCHGREVGLLALVLALTMLSRHIRRLGRILRGEEERKFHGRWAPCGAAEKYCVFYHSTGALWYNGGTTQNKRDSTMHNELTKRDIQMMKEELDYRHTQLRPQLLDAVKEARAFGDLSKNFGYKVAKQEKNRNESCIRFLENMIETAVVLSDAGASDGVQLYDRVTVFLEDEGDTEVYQMVTTMRQDALHGLISKESLLGKALLGRKVGETFHIQVNDTHGYDAVVRAIEKGADNGLVPLNRF